MSVSNHLGKYGYVNTMASAVCIVKYLKVEYQDHLNSMLALFYLLLGLLGYVFVDGRKLIQ